MKKIALILAGVLAVTTLAGCSSAASTASRNNVVATENFEVPVRISGINGITDEVLFTVEGYCSYEVLQKGGKDVLDVVCLEDRETEATSRTSLGLSDNVTFIRTQTGPVSTDIFRPRVIFRPETIVPNFDLSTSAGDLG